MGKGTLSANRGITGSNTMNWKFAKLFVLLCLLSEAVAQTYTALEFSRPEYKQRYHELTNKLRCLVCQNQPIAESNAELAVDLRKRVHEMIEQGKSDDEIVS